MSIMNEIGNELIYWIIIINYVMDAHDEIMNTE